MNDDNVYMFALVLASDRYANLSSFDALNTKPRAFRIFKWKPEVIDGREPATGEKIKVGGWTPFLFYTGTRWTRITNSKKEWKHMSVDGTMMKAHIFFKTEQDLKDWVGKESFKKMVIDLL